MKEEGEGGDVTRVIFRGGGKFFFFFFLKFPTNPWILHRLEIFFFFFSSRFVLCVREMFHCDTAISSREGGRI